MFHYIIQFLSYGNRRETLQALFTGISPRLGICRDLSDRFALTATFSPMLGYYWALSQKETTTGDAPDYFNHPKRHGITAVQADLRFIVKLGN